MNLYLLCLSVVQIRLIDGMKSTRNDNTRDGRVEVFSNGEWGTICNAGFDMQDANVICRQLGFPGNQSNNYNYGASYDKI